MRTILSYIFTPLYLSYFGLLLLIFHPIQVICRFAGGYSLRKRAVDVLNFLLLYGLILVGARVRFRGFKNLPKNRPLIIVSNHQSTFDIPPIVWGFRKHHPKFVSKKELGKGIPSISYNLVHGGSALIDRKNARQAIVEISRLGKHIEKENYSASIFPEGTRSKTGKLRPFKSLGVAALIKSAPSAAIVPFVIDGNSRLMEKGYFPLRFGTGLTFTALPCIEPKGENADDLTSRIQHQIENVLTAKAH